MKLSVVSKIIGIFVVVLSVSCVDSSPYFGNDIIPPHQGMITKIDSSIRINTYTIALDSIPSSNLGAIMYLGQQNSPLVGRTTCQLFSNYSPRGFADTEGNLTEDLVKKNFGSNPRIDSMILFMGFDHVSGDSLQTSKLEIFRVLDRNFYRDTTYYSNMSFDRYIGQTPLATYTLKGNTIVKVRLPLEYAKEHLDQTADTTSTYYNPRNFHKKFKGFYFRVTPNGSVGSFYKTSLSSGYMTLFYNNKDYSNKDTVLSQNFYFYNTSTYMSAYNTSVQTYKHDYTKADVSQGGVDYRVINDTINAQGSCYISGMGGLGSMVEFVSADVKNFVARAKIDINSSDPAIGIHKAEIVWRLKDQNWQNLNSVFSALGMYYNINRLSFIPDYDPIYIRNNASSGAKNTFGLLNRSNAEYKTDITGYVQRLVRAKSIPYRLQLYPEFSEASGVKNAVLWGGLADPLVKPYLVITYTLIK